jgi:glycosyltransferase involved in cell wall biosynthesis
MAAREIIGILLVKNEDLHARRAVENVRAFCDRLLLIDNGSNDGTPAILRQLAAEHPQMAFHPVNHPRISHDLIKPYAGTDTWIFGVDGDEIYDPAGLARLRPRILAGEFQNSWMLLGNVLNCDAVDFQTKQAAGYLAPPCRSITKLYNFSAIHSWNGDTPERLHGGNIDFKTGYDASLRRNLHEEMSWEESPLRCLHLCFTRRSSIDPATPLVRENIMEIHRPSFAARLRRFRKTLLGERKESDWKRSRYMRGERVNASIEAFIPETQTA